MASRSDNFNRADSSTGPGTPSDAGTAYQQWNTTGGKTYGIASNALYDVSDNGHLMATLNCGSGDADVQVTLAVFGDQMGLCGRVSGDNDHLFVRVVSFIGYDLFKRVSGVSTQLGSTYSTTPASGDVVKLSMSGSSLTVYVNGVSRITATDSFNATASDHGVWTFFAPTSARWDDLSITVAGGGGGVKSWANYYYRHVAGMAG